MGLQQSGLQSCLHVGGVGMNDRVCLNGSASCLPDADSQGDMQNPVDIHLNRR